MAYFYIIYMKRKKNKQFKKNEQSNKIYIRQSFLLLFLVKNIHYCNVLLINMYNQWKII